MLTRKEEMRLADKVAIVTGSGQGIGMAIAEGMAAEGASIVVSGLTPEKIQRVVDKIRKGGAKAIGVKADVTRRAEIKNLMETALKEYGQAHIQTVSSRSTTRQRRRRSIRSRKCSRASSGRTGST